MSIWEKLTGKVKTLAGQNEERATSPGDPDLLDLTIHSPDQYEGKLIRWHECDYIVGAHLRTGSKRVVHKLVNRESGLTLHVLKIYRNLNNSYPPSSEFRARLLAGGLGGTDTSSAGEIIPISIEIQIPGGQAEMQIGIGTEDEEMPASVLTLKGDKLLHESRVAEAIQAYEAALGINPRQTHALMNLAAAHAMMEQFAMAYNFAAQAQSIEPNYPLYHRACIQYLALEGHSRLALDEFRAMQEAFPNVFDYHDAGAKLYLECGDPASALKCAENCLLPPDEKQELIRTVANAVEAHSRTREMVDEARNLALENVDVSPILETLEKARTINQNDPMIAVNLGLALGRAGRRAEALPLLMEAAFRGPSHWRLLCFFNSALSAFAQGNAESAISLLDLVMSELERGWERANYSPTNNSLVADLPGIGDWADEQFTQEERLPSAFEFISRELTEYGKYHPIPESVSRLAELYAKAAAVS